MSGRAFSMLTSDPLVLPVLDAFRSALPDRIADHGTKKKVDDGQQKCKVFYAPFG